jgi:hypothetical protein
MMLTLLMGNRESWKTPLKQNACLIVGALWMGLAAPLPAAVIFDNSINVGLSNNWSAITGSSTVTTWSLPIDPANGCVFCRLVYP